MVLEKVCVRCEESKPETEFYRRRTNGSGRFIGEDARRGICRQCERERYPQAKKPEGEPRKLWTPQSDTYHSKHGIREALLARGLVPRTKEWKQEYFKLYAQARRKAANEKA